MSNLIKWICTFFADDWVTVTAKSDYWKYHGEYGTEICSRYYYIKYSDKRKLYKVFYHGFGFPSKSIMDDLKTQCKELNDK